MTCFVSKPSRITLVVLSIINTSYRKLHFGSGDYPDKLLYPLSMSPAFRVGPHCKDRVHMINEYKSSLYYQDGMNG